MNNESLRDLYRSLDNENQVLVTEFFQLHNMAIHRFNEMTVKAKEYVNEAIKYSQEQAEMNYNEVKEDK